MAITNEAHIIHAGGDMPLTVKASAPITGRRFVTITGSETGYGTLVNTATGGNITAAPATAAATCSGVARYDAADGGQCQIVRSGSIVQVEASATITAGAEVQIATGGKSVVLSTGVAVGRAITDGAASTPHYVELY